MSPSYGELQALLEDVAQGIEERQAELEEMARGIEDRQNEPKKWPRVWKKGRPY
jgi:hypothetical protein